MLLYWKNAITLLSKSCSKQTVERWACATGKFGVAWKRNAHAWFWNIVKALAIKNLESFFQA